MAKHGPPGWVLATPRMGTRSWGLGLLLTVLLVSCSSDSSVETPSDGPLVRLRLSAVDPLATHAGLSVTAMDSSGQTQPGMTTFPRGPFELLGVTFPLGTRGASSFKVNLYSEPDCLLATGMAALTIDSDGVFEVAVTMTAVPLCGNGATVAVQVVNAIGGSGSVASQPAGISCTGSTPGCSATFLKGTLITLTPTAQSGAFAGWSGSACTGLGSCTFMVTQDVQLQAVFTTCHGWCKEPLPFQVTANLNGVTGTAVNNVLVVGDAGTLLRWDGTSWQQPTSLSGTVALRAAQGRFGGTTISVAGDNGTILQLNGNAWSMLASGVGTNLRAIALSPGSTPITYFTGDNGTMLTLPSGGTSVSPRNIGTTVAIYGLSQNPNSTQADLFMGGALTGGKGFAQSWNGNTLTSAQMSSGGNIAGNIYAMLCGNAFHYAAGDGGAMVRRPSALGNPSNWVAVTSQANQTLRGMWSSSDSSITAVGDMGTIVQFDGTNWTRATSSITANLRAVWGSGPNNIYAVGDNGTLLHYLP